MQSKMASAKNNEQEVVDMNRSFHGRVLRLLVVGVAVLAFAIPTVAQQQSNSKPADSALVRLLESKGILTAEEAAMVSQASSAEEANQRLARLLMEKGLISQEEYTQTVGASVELTAAEASASARLVPAVMRTRDAAPPASPSAGPSPAPAPRPWGASAPSPPDPMSGPGIPNPQAAKGPVVIPAVAPIRTLPVDTPKREGLIPALKIGAVRVTPYGFFRTSAVYDTSMPLGNDFPLPGFIGDTPRNGSPEFRFKDRGLRIGSNFEWIDPSSKLTVTGRLEFDFEGNYNRSPNRNISSIRTNIPTLRLAFGRLDYKATDQTTLFALFGQDWTPFASSTLPSLFEITGLGVGFGTLYTRQPMVRGGFTHNFGGSRSFKITPEIALLLPAFGNVPGNTLQVTVPACAAVPCPATTVNVATAPGTGANGGNAGGTGVESQLAFGERQGTDSARPEVQGRLAFQWQLDKAPGVVPAQIIGSFFEKKRSVNVLNAAIPAAFRPDFPNGLHTSYEAAGVTGEIQLPTRWVTLIAKYYSGQDLRWFFGGQVLSNYTDLQTVGAIGRAAAFSADGSALITFGCSVALVRGVCPAASAAFGPQRPVRSQGGFVNLGFPLSRIFNADPAGRNAGWQFYLHWGIDEARARDVARIAPTSGNRVRGDLWAGTLYYKLNNWVTFAWEESLYRTKALRSLGTCGAAGRVTATCIGTFTTLFRGIPSRETHDVRSEFGTIFTF